MTTHAAQILILLLIAITFLQSGYDKLKDWSGNVEWLNGHFKDSFFGNKVKPALATVLVLEIISGVMALAGIIQLIKNDETSLGFYAAVLSCITLLMLLFGQRVAKDYDGARTIVIYFIPAILAVYWLG